MNKDFQKLYILLLQEKPEKSDVVVWLQGDRYDRASKILEIYKSGYVTLILISGNNTLIGPKTRLGENNISLPDMKNFLIKNGVKRKDIVIDDGALNTKEQGIHIIKLAKKNDWKSIILVSSSYHQPRAFLSIIKAMRVFDYNCKIINQSFISKENRKVSGREINRKDLIKEEIIKITSYQLKGDISSYEEGFDYLEMVKVPKLKFRPATIADADILLRWRNDIETRKSSLHGEKIKIKKHIEWLKLSLKNKDRTIYIVEHNSIPVGTIRTDAYKDGYELSWTVAPEARGKGVGRKMVKSFIKYANVKVYAHIKTDNEASKRIADYAGMSLIQSQNGILLFSRPAVKTQKIKLK